ncbi:phospho-acceptor domain-containing protein [Leeuwenhoekiella aestuarii]|uniref:hybrid sensor histidine kinase/response regulator n=1 Tax=Leeuwenhoekiella aestuarii TaxID=2249426 RepID=UPI000FFEB090|nr:response regulator [Leeuwenhoekiella aestuarii]RXG15002.1 phospho-acceptor domain-containing protein [Leeuwenhoekiella aestuarii]
MKLLPTVFTLVVAWSITYSQNIKETTTISPDSTKEEIVAYLKSNIKKSAIEFEKENYPASILYNYKNLRLAEKIGDSLLLAISRSHIANDYLRLDNPEQARDYIDKNIIMAESMNDTALINAAKIDLANIYLEEKNYEDFIRLNKEVIVLAKHVKDNRRLIISSLNIADAYLFKLERADLARPYLDSLRIYNANETREAVKIPEEDFYYLEGKYDFLKENFSGAKENFSFVLNHYRDYQKLDYLLESYSGYIHSLGKLGAYEEAYDSFGVLDTLFERKLNSIQEESNKILKHRLKIESIEQQIKHTELQSKIIAARAQNNRTLLGASVIIVIALVTVLIFFIYERKKRSALVLQLQCKNEEYLEAKDKSEEMTRIKTKFLSTISHELRTPLYGIIGLSDYLFQKSKLSEYAKELQSLKFSAHYLLNLVNDVLTLNKIESGTSVETEHKPFNLQELIDGICLSLKFMKKQNSNTLTIEIAEEIPKIVIGDKIKLSQIIINLVGNALKFTKNGEIKILINLVQKVDNAVTLKFEIQDNGIGISEAEHHEIFREFTNLNKTSLFAGTGLGLSIVTKLLKEMDSQIQLTSELGVGSTFYFIVKLDTPDPLEQNVVSGLASANEKQLCGKKILIIDDNHINQMVTQKYVERFGATAKAVDTAIEGIKLLKAERFDLILMDLNMPKINGLKATSIIRTFNKDIKIIILSATEVQELRTKIKGYDINDFLSKPHKTEDLQELLTKHLIE